MYTWAAARQNQQMACAPSEDSDQPEHPPSLIRVFAVRFMGIYGTNLSSCVQRRFWSDWTNALADLNPLGADFVGFVMLWLKWFSSRIFTQYIKRHFYLRFFFPGKK